LILATISIRRSIFERGRRATLVLTAASSRSLPMRSGFLLAGAIVAGSRSPFRQPPLRASPGGIRRSPARVRGTRLCHSPVSRHCIVGPAARPSPLPRQGDAIAPQCAIELRRCARAAGSLPPRLLRSCSGPLPSINPFFRLLAPPKAGRALGDTAAALLQSCSGGADHAACACRWTLGLPAGVLLAESNTATISMPHIVAFRRAPASRSSSWAWA